MAMFRSAKPKGLAGLAADTVLGPGQNVIPLTVLHWSEGDVGFVPGSGFQVGRAGLYLCTGSLSRAAVGTTSGVQVKVLRNGTQSPPQPTIIFPSSTAATTVQVVALYPCDVSDVLQLAGTMHGTAAATARAIGTYLTVVRIGPERWT